MGLCECGEDDGVLRIKPTWLWPRRRRAAAGAAELGAVAVVLESENGKGER